MNPLGPAHRPAIAAALPYDALLSLAVPPSTHITKTSVGGGSGLRQVATANQKYAESLRFSFKINNTSLKLFSNLPSNICDKKLK